MIRKSFIKLFSVIALAISLCHPAHAVTVGNSVPLLSSTAAEASHIFKAAQGYLYGFSVTSGASAGFVMIFDSATDPANGAVTPGSCYQLPANNTVSGYFDKAVPYANGITLVFSTTGCTTKTESATAFFTAQVQ